jgi:hypothetical protein
MEDSMKSADEEIAVRVIDKLQETGKWSKALINKIDFCLKEGSVSSKNIIFLIENQDADENGVKK